MKSTLVDSSSSFDLFSEFSTQKKSIWMKWFEAVQLDGWKWKIHLNSKQSLKWKQPKGKHGHQHHVIFIENEKWKSPDGLISLIICGFCGFFLVLKIEIYLIKKKFVDNRIIGGFRWPLLICCHCCCCFYASAHCTPIWPRIFNWKLQLQKMLCI